MPEIDREKIERGKLLSDLRASDEFKPLLAEWEYRIKSNSEQVLAFRSASVAAEVGVPYYLYRYQGLSELLEWIDREIESGIQEANNLRQSERTLA